MLSVVIPVYKTPRYALERCLNSVLSFQGDVEVICVLDSPGDACGDVLTAFAQREKRMRLFVNETNQGVSFTRNRGMDYAQGDVLTFVDADDEIEPATYEQALKFMLVRNLDMCVCMSPNGGSWRGVEVGEFIETSFPSAEGEKLTAIVSALGQSCWGALWKRKTLVDRNIRFSVGLKWNEDFLFSTHLINSGGRFGWLNKDGYHRIGCEESVTKQSMTPQLTLDKLDAQCMMLPLLQIEALPVSLRAWYARNFLGNVFGNRHVAKLFPKEIRHDFDERLTTFLKMFVEKGLLSLCTLPTQLLLCRLRHHPTRLIDNYWTMALPMAALLKYKKLVRHMP